MNPIENSTMSELMTLTTLISDPFQSNKKRLASADPLNLTASVFSNSQGQSAFPNNSSTMKNTSEDLGATATSFVSNPPGPVSSKDPGTRKINMIRPDVFHLTKDLFPLRSYKPLNLDKNAKRPSESWVRERVIFSQDPDQQAKAPILHSWVKKSDSGRLFPFAKFKKSVELVKYTPEDFKRHLAEMDLTWTEEETKYLWDLLELFECRFLVVADRYDYHPEKSPVSKDCPNRPRNRSIDEIKCRFYSVSKKLLDVRNQKNHPLYNFEFDIDYERFRKFQLAKYLNRSKEKMEEERRITEELKQIEQLIKKEERGQSNLQKILDVEIRDEDDEGIRSEDENLEERFSDPVALADSADSKSYTVLRGSVMNGPIPEISSKINKKMELILSELGIPERPMATHKINRLYDELRKKLLIMFNLQRHLKKKEEELKNVETGGRNSSAERNSGDGEVGEKRPMNVFKDPPVFLENHEENIKKVKME